MVVVQEGDVSQEVRDLLANEEDLEAEQEISRNPYRLKGWLSYLDRKSKAGRKARNILHERALKFLPGSYKLWLQYLTERRAAVKGRCVTSNASQIVVNCFERALVHLHKMPKIWELYCTFLMGLQRGTATRRAFDRALQALPITQHDRIWPIYVEWAKQWGVKETAVRVFRRFLMFDPMHREEYVEYLEGEGLWLEAARQLAECVNNRDFRSPKGTSKHALWTKLCDICARNPVEVAGAMQVEAIIRSGLARFTDEVGRLWCKLADYYIRLGQFERARDIYEEAANTVMTVKDFTVVFDAYTQFEESVLTAKMQMAGEEEEEEGADDDLDADGDDVGLRLARLENLLERRPLLVSSVLLRQNPHNCYEWAKRVKLFSDDPRRVITCYTEAVKTVEPSLAVGQLSHIWLAFAKFYEDHGDLVNARAILEKAVQVAYKRVDELASLWCAWAEMELRHDKYDEALGVMKRATTEPPMAVQRRRAQAGMSRDERKRLAKEIPVQERVHRSTRCWNLLLDLEESLGTVETSKAAYERVLELKAATPQMILNFGSFLEENKYFEESFRAYEKGVSVFGFPHVLPIWHRYLDKFVERYGGSKLERARDMFEQAVSTVPEKNAAEIYLKYEKLEEEHGLVRKATNILERACQAVPVDQKLDMWKLYVTKVEKFYGITHTRPVYEKAIGELPEDGARELCLDFAKMEQGLGEVDRARAVLTHGSQFADPRRNETYWETFHDFEVAHGNEETFREMLRIKRSVMMSYSNVNYMAAEMIAGEQGTGGEAEALERLRAEERDLQNMEPEGDAGPYKRGADEGGAAETGMEALERQASKIRAAKAAENPEEIDLDDDMDEEEEEEESGDVNLSTKAVPDAVFGSAKEAAAKEKFGALERMKAKQ
ncbi:unnamed protein product [Chrysoparadoxa australica]